MWWWNIKQDKIFCITNIYKPPTVGDLSPNNHLMSSSATRHVLIDLTGSGVDAVN